MHNLWKQCGMPRSGVINAARMKAKYDYKLAIKMAESDFEKAHADQISDYLLKKKIRINSGEPGNLITKILPI